MRRDKTGKNAVPLSPQPQGAGSIPVPPAPRTLNSWGLLPPWPCTLGVHWLLFGPHVIPPGATPQVFDRGPVGDGGPGTPEGSSRQRRVNSGLAAIFPASSWTKQMEQVRSTFP